MITAPESAEKRLADLDDVIDRHAAALGETVGVYVVITRPSDDPGTWHTDCYPTPEAARGVATELIRAGHDVIAGVARVAGLKWL